MEILFDRMYPDVVVQEQVEFDKETLLIKLYNSRGGAVTGGTGGISDETVRAIFDPAADVEIPRK